MREAREETGSMLIPADLRVVGVRHHCVGAAEYIDFFVATERWGGAIPNTEPHKCAELARQPLERLPPNTIPYVRHALEHYRRGVWFDSVDWE